MEMSHNKNYTYQIKNLNCPNCALKIEKKINALNEISYVNLDLINNKLSITSSDHVDILKKMNKIADHIEPGVKITEILDETEGINQIKRLSLISGFILFIIAYLNLFSQEISTILFLTSYVLVGYEVIYKAFRNITRGQIFDENLLMMLATFAAIFVKSYPEAVAVMLFYEVGEYFQELSLDRSRRSIKQLIDIQPKFAHVKQNNELKTVDPHDVLINSIIVVKPGEKIPLDGMIIDGQSSVDSSQLTGESIPKNVEVNDEVLAGFINYNGLLTIKVTKKYEDTTVSKILDLVQNAQSKKAKVEKFITKFAKIYTPIVILLAILTVILPMFFVSNYQFNDYLYRGAIFLVVSCPCALVISIPLSIFGGIGASSKQGILIKGGNYLEVIRKVNIIVFDKTGTLTKGNFAVTKVININDNLDDMVEKTIYAEHFSNHAIAKAIVSYQTLKLDPSKIDSFEEIFGLGVHAFVDGSDVLAGNEKLMKAYNIQFSEVNEIGTVIYIAINQTFVGYFVIEDEIKQEAKSTIENLYKLGISKTVMLTGDSQVVAEHVGKTLSIDEVYASLLPEHKLTLLEKLKKENPKVKMMFVGDGVNDTPVMMASDVGVAMGALGSDAAIETSDVVIMNDNLSKLTTAIKLARITHRKVWQNISLALGVKFFVLMLSAFGFATMWEAVFADVGVTLLAVFNSILILRYKEK